MRTEKFWSTCSSSARQVLRLGIASPQLPPLRLLVQYLPTDRYIQSPCLRRSLRFMSDSYLSAAEDRSMDAGGLDKMMDLSIEGNDPSSWGGLVFGDNRKAWVKAEFEKAAGGSGRLSIKEVCKSHFPVQICLPCCNIPTRWHIG